ARLLAGGPEALAPAGQAANGRLQLGVVVGAVLKPAAVLGEGAAVYDDNIGPPGWLSGRGAAAVGVDLDDQASSPGASSPLRATTASSYSSRTSSSVRHNILAI